MKQATGPQQSSREHFHVSLRERAPVDDVLQNLQMVLTDLGLFPLKDSLLKCADNIVGLLGQQHPAVAPPPLPNPDY